MLGLCQCSAMGSLVLHRLVQPLLFQLLEVQKQLNFQVLVPVLAHSLLAQEE